MKTIVDIEDALMKKAMKAVGAKTKKETIRLALEEMIKLKMRQRLTALQGSGILDMSLEELKRLRKRRQLKHAALRKKSA